MSDDRRYPHCRVWDYWANGGTEGRKQADVPRYVHGSYGRDGYGEWVLEPVPQPVTGHRRNGYPPTKLYVWQSGEPPAAQPTWVQQAITRARVRAREIIAQEIRNGQLPGVTLEDLDQTTY